MLGQKTFPVLGAAGEPFIICGSGNPFLARDQPVPISRKTCPKNPQIRIRALNTLSNTLVSQNNSSKLISFEHKIPYSIFDNHHIYITHYATMENRSSDLLNLGLTTYYTIPIGCLLLPAKFIYKFQRKFPSCQSWLINTLLNKLKYSLIEIYSRIYKFIREIYKSLSSSKYIRVQFINLFIVKYLHRWFK